MAKKDQGPLNDENEQPRPYDENAAKAVGNAITERQVADPDAIPVPDGVGFDAPDPREDRAQYAREHQGEQVKTDPEHGPPSPQQVFAQKAQLEKEARTQSVPRTLPDETPPPLPGRGPWIPEATEMLSDGLPVELDAPRDSMPKDRPFYPEEVQKPADKVASAALYILVIERGGRWRAIEFTNFEYMCGFVQNVPGNRHLFQKVAGKAEYQEIKGNGEPIIR